MAAADAQPVRIGTRGSQLAMWQANLVAERLRAQRPALDVQVKAITTMGDKILHVPLTAFSSKGVFTKELDVALLAGEIDIAVHCVKDLPTVLPPGLAIVAVTERGETEDALVLHEKHRGATLESLPAGAVIGTSALRRRAALARLFPKLSCKDVRGNLQTRLAKLDRGEYDALILAAVGLRRIGLGHRISAVLSADKFGYAVGQGALAVVARTGDEAMRQLCAPLEHADTKVVCLAERALLRSLEGGCKVPIAVRSHVGSKRAADGEADGAAAHKQARTLELWAGVTSVDGAEFAEAVHAAELQPQRSDDAKGDKEDDEVVALMLGARAAAADAVEERAVRLGCELARKLRGAGAEAILRRIRDSAADAEDG